MTPDQYRLLLQNSDAKVRAQAEAAFQALLARIRNGESPQPAIKAVMRQFNAGVTSDLAQVFSALLSTSIGVAEMRDWPVGGVKLSDVLYTNAQAVSATTRTLIEAHLKGPHAARELAKALYEGYDFKADPLDVAGKLETLPNYLKVEFNKAMAAKLKTPALRAAYLQAIAEQEKGKGTEALQRVLKTAFYERNRYYANRIARTELHRAYTDRQSRELMQQDRIEYVQLRLSSKHPKPDVCDLHARLNAYGLGAGIYPKADAPKPPFHPFCICAISPVVNLSPKLKPRFNPQAERAFLAGLPGNEARQVAGSIDKLDRILAGKATLEEVYNEGKDPLYQWKKVGEVGQDVLMSGNSSDFLEGRSRARGELPKQAKPTVPGTMPADQLSKLEGDAKAYVVGQGKKDGKEHLYAYDLNSGKVLARATSNQREAVAVPAELTKLASDPNQQIAYHHSHPDSFSLSLRDLGLLNRRPGLAKVVAHGHDGSWYQAIRGDMKNFNDILIAADSEMDRQADLVRRRGASIAGIDAHLVNLALDAEGVIQYQYKLSPELSDHFEKDRAAYEQIVDELRYAIKRAR